jgi:hypothetical protein
MALRMAATTLLNSKSYLGGRYRHLRRQLPFPAAAVKAMARYLAVLVFRMLAHGEARVDRGAARFEQRRTELELTTLNFKARAKGFTLVPITDATEEFIQLSAWHGRRVIRVYGIVLKNRLTELSSPFSPPQNAMKHTKQNPIT